MAVFTDNFTRANTSLGGVGNGWVDSNNHWQITSNLLTGAGAFIDDPILRPLEETPVRVSVTATMTLGPSNANYTSKILALKYTAGGSFYYAYSNVDNGNGQRVVYIGRGLVGNVNTPYAGAYYSGSPTALKITLTLDGTNLSVFVYDAANPTTQIATASHTISDTVLTGGQNGVFDFNGTSQLSYFEVDDLASGGNQVVPDYKVVIDGDSISDSNTGPGLWISPVATILGSDYEVSSIAVSGQSVSDMLSDFNSQVVPLKNNARTANILVCAGGTNDLALQGVDWTVCRDRRIQYCQEGRTAGFRVVLCSILPRKASFAGITSGSTDADKAVIFEGLRQQINAYDQANWRTYADAYGEWNTDSRLADPANTTFYGDQVHPTQAGANFLANSTAPAIVESYTPNGGVTSSGSSSSPSVQDIVTGLLTALPTATVGTVTVVTTTTAVTNPVHLDNSQPLQVSPTAGTVGEALAVARAQAIGKESLSNNTLTTYAHDGTTVLHVNSISTDSNGNAVGRGA